MNEPRKPSETGLLPGSASEWLRRALNLGAGETAFPWQEELLSCFEAGALDRWDESPNGLTKLDIPTGLGKTAVMAIWLIARARGAAVPRRLVYVVDRRAVVDQATNVAEELRACVGRERELQEALGLTGPLPISTLRGQHVDNKKWLEDPASPAIIVGTIDMVGSRLLFEGYGTSRKMRPYHAGLLGADTLIALDEAHLVPPFEKLLETITVERDAFGPRDVALRASVPTLKVLSLSATGRSNGSRPFTLTEGDEKHPEVRRRLDASKRIQLVPRSDVKLEEALARHAWDLAEHGKRAVRCIIFSSRREVAQAGAKAIERLAKAAGIADTGYETELFVGGRRIRERQDAAERLKGMGFIAGSQVAADRPAFLFATSAGEVGVDLDADHMVSDLVEWERMVQRLGRVNRRGRGNARVIIVTDPEPTPTKTVEEARKKEREERTAKESKALADFEGAVQLARKLRAPFDYLSPNCEGGLDASPGALRALKLRADTDAVVGSALHEATSEAPIRPALTRALVDAWSMTSLHSHTGRPPVAPWLRGWRDDPPQTTIVWRRYLPVRTPHPVHTTKPPTKLEVAQFFEAAPPHASEWLETETHRVAKWATARAHAVLARKQSDVPVEEVSELAPLRRHTTIAIALDRDGGMVGQWSVDQLASLHAGGSKALESLQRALGGVTLVVDARIGGLDASGLLHESADTTPPTVDSDDARGWVPTLTEVGFMVRSSRADDRVAAAPGWRPRHEFAAERSEEGEATRLLIIDKWRADAATEEDRSAGWPQLLAEHQQWARDRATSLAERLGLDEQHRRMLEVAAFVHDEGKRVRRWQLAFQAPKDGLYAKTRGPIRIGVLDGYRHELGSMPLALENSEFRALPGDLRELALHLVVAHHGFGRPVISVRSCDDAPPSVVKERAREVALRFARLQKRWGPWGLAWWEALLRAADQQASRANDERAAKQEGL